VTLLNGLSQIVQQQIVTAPEAFVGGSTFVRSVASALAGITKRSNTYYGVDINGNINNTPRTFASANEITGLTQSASVGDFHASWAYSTTNAYISAVDLISDLFMGPSRLVRIEFSAPTTFAATYNGTLDGDLDGVAFDGTAVWVMERFSNRIRKLNATTLAVEATHTFTGPTNGLAYADGKLFFVDDDEIVAWDIAGAVEDWRESIPAPASRFIDIAATNDVVALITFQFVHCFDANDGTLLYTYEIGGAQIPGTRVSATVYEGDIVFAGTQARPDRFIVIDGTTGEIKFRFGGLGFEIVGAVDSEIFLSSSAPPVNIGVSRSIGVVPISTLSGLTAQVAQLSGTGIVGRVAELNL